jgi:hypothetical protein
MSTSTASAVAGAPTPTPRLRQVSSQPTQLARIPFLVMLSVVLAAGMVGVLILNTVIQGQSSTLRDAQNQATALANEQAALETQVDQLRSVTYLMQAASAVGMRPNPDAVVLRLSDGTVFGTPTPAPADALPDQVWTGPVTQLPPPSITVLPPPNAAASSDGDGEGGH